MDPEMTRMPGGHVIVTLSGELDIACTAMLREVLALAISRAAAGVVADLAGVTFLDAAVLGVLAEASRAARQLPGGLRLAAVPSPVLRLLELTRLDRHLAAFPGPPGPGHWSRTPAAVPLPRPAVLPRTGPV